MNINVNRKSLIDALRFGGMVAGKNKTIPILDYCKVAVKGGKMVVTSTDTEVTIAKKIDGVDCDVEQAEFCIVPSDLVTTLATLRDDIITLEVSENNCTLVHSRGKATVAVLPSQDFPSPNNNENKASFTLDAAKLKYWLDSAKNFVGDDPLRQAITGMYLAIENGEAWCCASDSQKLYMDGYKDEAFNGMSLSLIISQRTFGYASPILDGYERVNVQVDDNHIAFIVPDAKVTARLIVGAYPKVRQLLPQTFPILVEMNTADFASSVSRMKLFADKTRPRVDMDFGVDGVRLVSSDLMSNKSCEDSCDVLSYDGNSIGVCTQVSNLEAIVAKIETETFCVGMSAPNRPIVFYEAGNPNKILFTMPLIRV